MSDPHLDNMFDIEPLGEVLSSEGSHSSSSNSFSSALIFTFISVNLAEDYTENDFVAQVQVEFKSSKEVKERIPSGTTYWEGYPDQENSHLTRESRGSNMSKVGSNAHS